MLELFFRGGWIMYPILLCSVASLTVFFERMWALRPSRIVPASLAEALISAISRSEFDQAIAQCEAHPGTPLAKIARAGLAHVGRSPEILRFTIAEAGGQEAARFERGQRILATVAYIAPLLGLFGTVSGMIKAFDIISKHSIGDPAMLAAGISEALITTYGGLLVAIPTVIMHKVVQSRASRLSLELENQSAVLAEHLMSLPPASQGRGPQQLVNIREAHG